MKGGKSEEYNQQIAQTTQKDIFHTETQSFNLRASV
jgi:hypothetical protein